MSITIINDFIPKHSDLLNLSIRNWTQLPLNKDEIVIVKGKKYLIVETQGRLLYSNIELIKRRCLGIAISLCLGTSTFIITTLISQSPLLKIITTLSSIAILYLFPSAHALFFQRIETFSTGMEIDDTKERLITLFGQKMIAALGGFEAVSKLKDDWDGKSELQHGIQYGLDRQKRVFIAFSFLCNNFGTKRYEKKMALIRKNKEGWEILESNGFIRFVEFDGNQTLNSTVSHGTHDEIELLKRVARFTKGEALSSFVWISFSQKEFLPEKGKTSIFRLDCPSNDFEKVNQAIKYLNNIKFVQ